MMSKNSSFRDKWRAVLQQQSISNAKRWIKLLEESTEPDSLISSEYENLLRALESTLQSIDTFALAYQLILAMHVTVVDFADWDRWLFYLDQAFTLSKRRESHEQTADLLVKIGEIQYRMGKLKAAKHAYQSGADKYLQLNASADYARTLARIAVLYDLQGNTQKGIDLCTRALTIAEDVKDNWGIAQINLNLSNIHRRTRNWELSLSTANKAYDIFQRLSKTKEATKALVNIVSTLAEMGEWEVVNLISHNLIDQLEASSDVYTLSHLKNNLGIAAFTQADYSKAELAWQEALRLHSQIQEPKELANLYNNLGMVYTQLTEWETAEDMLGKAVKAYISLGDIYNCANAMDNLADLYEKQGRQTASQETLQKAYTILQEIEDMPHARELRAYIRSRLST